MATNKVEICGVNTSKLPVLTNEDLVLGIRPEFIDIAEAGVAPVSTTEMGKAVCDRI